MTIDPATLDQWQAQQDVAEKHMAQYEQGNMRPDSEAHLAYFVKHRPGESQARFTLHECGWFAALEYERERTNFARTALPLAIAALREHAWRPLSEAPKDGTWILVYVPSEDERLIAAYDEAAQLWFTDGNAEIESEITLWQPLPALPQQEG